jgi:hypothetical protein
VSTLKIKIASTTDVQTDCRHVKHLIRQEHNFGESDIEVNTATVGDIQPDCQHTKRLGEKYLR